MKRWSPVHGAFLALVLLLAGAAPLLLLAEPPSTLATGALASDGLPPRVHLAGRDASVRFAGLAGLDPRTEALLIVSPRSAFSEDDVRDLHAFLASGGRVLLAVDGTIGRELLEDLSLGVQLSGSRVYSPSFRDDPGHILARSTGRVPALPSEVVLTRPLLLRGGDAILRPPALAWEDLNANGRPDLDEPAATGSLATEVAAGDGILVVVGDPDAVLDAADVAGPLLDHVTQGRRLVVDESHRPRSDPLTTNGLLAGKAAAWGTTGILMTSLAVGASIVLRPRVQAREAARKARADTRGVPRETLSDVLGELDPR